ncbi:MAG: FlgD immunoglobulin-like domain containing protein, partial [Rhodothermales bacterium]|nr:FlgD immunoglobulin-like domain containing protein [Rhodothermales bacterium]
PSHVRVTIYDVAGRRVITMYDRAAPAGSSIVTWNGRSSDGRQVPAGIYFIVMESDASGRSIRAVARM